MLSFYEREPDVPLPQDEEESPADMLRHATFPESLPDLDFVPSWLSRRAQEQNS